MLGQVDEAHVRAEWLMAHAPQMPYGPFFEPLRGDPEFARIV
jgi:hypothetical protein